MFFILILCFITCFAEDKCPIQCKITKICIEISQKCDDIVNCCQGDNVDQSDESYCGTILSPLPPTEIYMLESLMIQLVFHILPEFGTDEYMAHWLINGNQIGASDTAYDIKLTETSPRYYSFTILSPELSLDNATLGFQIIEKKRTYETVCNKKPSVRGSAETVLFVKKRPAKPVIVVHNRKDIIEGRQKGFYLSCTSNEGFVKPKLIWIKTVSKVPKEYETNLMTDVLDSKKIYTLLQVSNPQSYVDYSIQCRTSFDFLNDTLGDTSEEYIFEYPFIESTSSEGEMIVRHGSPLNLTCRAKGFPPPLLKWAYAPSPLTPVPIRLLDKKSDTLSSSAGTGANFLNAIWLTMTGKKRKPTYVNREFIYIPTATIDHSGFYQCIASNEIGDSGSNIIQVIVPDPSLGFLSTYFVSKESFIGFTLGMVIFVIVVGLIMYFVYGKVTTVLETRNKLLIEQAAEAKRRLEEARAGRHRKGAGGPTNPNDPESAAPIIPGRKVLKGPPPISDVEMPFISVMDQVNVIPIDEDDKGGAGLAKFDDANFVPPLREDTVGTSRNLLDFVPEFQYPDEDDDQILNLLKNK